ncbi:hypothetical protein B0I18_10168 [Taibaiella chishuiensis]|uniref:Uncharacterized protein n=1 Tax=Taibaiella chishuiensis TaxID=1434707 RepID=A0A2P8D9M1_9BACT|nr:hypothetical protein B0I18_10168 [Taibaiella chishuiensis]
MSYEVSVPGAQKIAGNFHIVVDKTGAFLYYVC